jgi:hypothetical protein
MLYLAGIVAFSSHKQNFFLYFCPFLQSVKYEVHSNGIFSLKNGDKKMSNKRAERAPEMNFQLARWFHFVLSPNLGSGAPANP